jgi:uncharacterized protein (DUF1778 family)
MGDQAELQGKTRSEFMLEAACEKAQNVLLDQTTFVLDTRRFRRSLEHEIAHTALDHEESSAPRSPDTPNANALA